MRKIVTAVAGLIATAVLLVAPAATASAAPGSTTACYGCLSSR